ncbi:MAG TPA: PEGA domain-containing protein [bacterium]|nr:PEGA domain-containing protein [bacterium]HPN41976.1 PEGA domain-containing protein [bacterium]
MKKHLLVFLLLLLVSTTFAQIGGRTQVAVMNLEASGIEQSAIIALSDRLRMELLNTGRFDVMERNRMDTILKEQGLQQSGACNTTECVVEMGQILGVDRMISGSVGKVGRIYSLFVQMVDIETGRIMMSKVEDCDCPIEDVYSKSVQNIALKMAGLAPGQMPDGEPLPMVVDGKGDFYFNSEPPGAKILIDGKQTAVITPGYLEGVQAGMHIIRMETDNYTGSETVFLEADEFKRVELKLERAKGGLKVMTTPLDAELFIDNSSYGLTPKTVTGLDAGEHLIRLSKSGYVDHIERVVIRGDETTRLEANMIKWAYLTVTSDPADAEVFIDNSKLGVTPLAGQQMKPGSYQISVRKEGFTGFYGMETLAPEKNTVLNVTLQLTPALPVVDDTRPTSIPTPDSSTKPAELEAKKDGFPWLWVGLGAVAVGGSAAYLLSTDKETTGEISFRVPKN